MKINAIKCPSCKDVLYSRSRHDFRYCSCEEVSIDGGFEYSRISFNKEMPQRVEIEVKVTKTQLHEDWTTDRNKYGLIKSSL